MNAGCEQGRGKRCVCLRRCGDDRSVDLPGKLVGSIEPFNRFGYISLVARALRINDGDQPAIWRAKAGLNMEASHAARANDRHANFARLLLTGHLRSPAG